ncbi:MAG: AraC family transcriptional regulator [Oceanococcaceae bacterium]
MAHPATTLGSWFTALHAELQRRGLDASTLFAEAGVDPASLQQPQARVPLDRSRALWALAVERSGDPALGLAVASRVRQTTFHALGFAVLASATLEQALQRIVRYFRVVSDAAELRLEPLADGVRFRICALAGPEQPADEAVDALMAVLVRSCRALAGPDFRPMRTRLRRPAPVDPAPYRQCFGPDLRFGATDVLLDISTADAFRPLPFGNEDIAQHNEAMLQKLLASQAEQGIVAKVRALLVPQLSAGEPGQEQIATKLHLSLRQLQRKLQQEDTTFRQVLEDTRRDLALEYLRDSRYSVSEVAWLIGFGDSGSFSRAFRRWTGSSPSDWKANPPAPSA